MWHKILKKPVRIGPSFCYIWIGFRCQELVDISVVEYVVLHVDWNRRGTPVVVWFTAFLQYHFLVYENKLNIYIQSYLGDYFWKPKKSTLWWYLSGVLFHNISEISYKKHYQNLKLNVTFCLCDLINVSPFILNCYFFIFASLGVINWKKRIKKQHG